MRVNVFPQIAVVESESAVDFQNKFNSTIRQLAEKNPEYRIIEKDSFCAIITYTEKERVIENVKDEYNEAGIHYRCKHCPYLEDPKDKRIKYCECGIKGATHKDHEACVIFYEQLKEGIIQPLDDYLR